MNIAGRQNEFLSKEVFYVDEGEVLEPRNNDEREFDDVKCWVTMEIVLGHIVLWAIADVAQELPVLGDHYACRIES